MQDVETVFFLLVRVLQNWRFSTTCEKEEYVNDESAHIKRQIEFEGTKQKIEGNSDSARVLVF